VKEAVIEATAPEVMEMAVAEVKEAEVKAAEEETYITFGIGEDLPAYLL